MKKQALFCGEKPIPDDDPELESLKRIKASILSISREQERIVLSAEKQLTNGNKIVFTGCRIICEGGERQFADFTFLQHFEAKIGCDLVPMIKQGNCFLYAWTHPPVTFLDDHNVGDTLTFCEVKA